jgi:hypothetical protein
MFNVEDNARKIGEKVAREAVKQGKNAQEAAKLSRQAEREAKANGNKWIAENVGLN